MAFSFPGSQKPLMAFCWPIFFTFPRGLVPLLGDCFLFFLFARGPCSPFFSLFFSSHPGLYPLASATPHFFFFFLQFAPVLFLTSPLEIFPSDFALLRSSFSNLRMHITPFFLSFHPPPFYVRLPIGTFFFFPSTVDRRSFFFFSLAATLSSSSNFLLSLFSFNPALLSPSSPPRLPLRRAVFLLRDSDKGTFFSHPPFRYVAYGPFLSVCLLSFKPSF